MFYNIIELLLKKKQLNYFEFKFQYIFLSLVIKSNNIKILVAFMNFLFSH